MGRNLKQIEVVIKLRKCDADLLCTLARDTKIKSAELYAAEVLESHIAEKRLEALNSKPIRVKCHTCDRQSFFYEYQTLDAWRCPFCMAEFVYEAGNPLMPAIQPINQQAIFRECQS